MKSKLSKGALAILLVLGVSCTEQQAVTTDNVEYASILNVATDGLSTVISPNLQAALTQTSDLFDDELSVLLKMKEEEKLAHDVYATLYAKWSNPVFSRISAAESNHMNAIIDLLQYYETADTTVAAVGVFQNEELQTLYNELVTTGSLSLEESFAIGALIEEMDIKDLQDGMQGTANENILLVYENLKRGSRNHLRSFNRQLISLGIVYTPIYISQDEFDEIVNSSFEKGNRYAMNGGGCGSGNTNQRGHGNGPGYGGGQHGPWH